jgi:alanine racemase
MVDQSRIEAEIDLSAIRENLYSMLEGQDPKKKVIAVVKANAYGHGALRVASALEDEECLFGFAVATAAEALELREGGIRKPILLLGYVFPEHFEELIEKEVRFSVFDSETLRSLSEKSNRLGREALVHIPVDTAMSRIGIFPDEEGLSFVREAFLTRGVRVEGIFTHFARADETDLAPAKEQYAKFDDFIKKAQPYFGGKPPLIHCANSAATMRMPALPYPLVRAGITLYGLEPSSETRDLRGRLRPALSLYSKITFIKEVPEGVPVSYGGSFVTEKRTRIATVCAGYADGYPRGASPKGFVLIHGKRAKILGRICMDQMMVDVSEIPEAVRGDRVTLIGKDGMEEIRVETLSEWSGRFHYELICDLTPRVARIYKE